MLIPVCPESNPELGDVMTDSFFSWVPRHVENNKIAWLQKIYVIKIYSHSEFDDMTSVHSKVLIGGKPSLYQLIFAGGQDKRIPNWNTLKAFSSAEARTVYLQKEFERKRQSARIWARLLKTP